MKQAIYVPVLLMGVLFASTDACAEMYKWTDKNGETHYTATPPPPNAKGKDIEDEIKLSTGKLGNLPAPASASQEPKDDMDQAREDGKKSEAQHRDFCKQQSSALKQMTANALIKWKDSQGERFLTAEEKTKKMKEIEKNLSSMCKPEMFSNTPDRETSQTEAAFGGRTSQENTGMDVAGAEQNSGNAGTTGNSGTAGNNDSVPDGTALPATD